MVTLLRTVPAAFKPPETKNTHCAPTALEVTLAAATNPAESTTCLCESSYYTDAAAASGATECAARVVACTDRNAVDALTTYQDAKVDDVKVDKDLMLRVCCCCCC
jgi:hypothetical protein